MKVFTIAGWSGCGKTTLISRLIKQLKTNNYKVIAVKNVPHKFYLEPESTDSFKFLEAGADEACLAASHQLMSTQLINNKSQTVDILKTRYTDCDYLLLEGLRNDSIPLIEVFDSSKHRELKFPPPSLTAIVADKPLNFDCPGIPFFHRDNIMEIKTFLEDYNE
jgi:molybdopterin-guanine dinucleotide biosynthesis adapter protein